MGFRQISLCLLILFRLGGISLREVDVSQYYPEIMQNAREFKYLTTAENPELNLVQQELQNILNVQFIRDSTENGVVRREKMLKITPFASDTLDERKFRLLARYNEDIPYTVPNLRIQLANICGAGGYRLTIVNNTFTIIVKVELVAKKKLDTVREFLERVVPLNMIIDLDLMYNQHKTLHPYTHNQLKQFTHSTLRNEVFNIG
jgi:hypothetical protein